MVQHVPVDFAGDYTFRNDTAEAQTVDFRLKFPAQKAICDGLQMKVNDQAVARTTSRARHASSGTNCGPPCRISFAGTGLLAVPAGGWSRTGSGFHAYHANQFPGHRLR